jgi:hypothetical protein
MKLSEIDIYALKLASNGILTSTVPDKKINDYGVTTPSKSTFSKLIKLGLVFETIEEPIKLENDVEFFFTTQYYLTDKGVSILANYS